MHRGYRSVLTGLQALLFPYKDCLRGRRLACAYFSPVIFLLRSQYNNNLQILTKTFGRLIQAPELAAAVLVVLRGASITASYPTSSGQPNSFEDLPVQRPRN